MCIVAVQDFSEPPNSGHKSVRLSSYCQAFYSAKSTYCICKLPRCLAAAISTSVRNTKQSLSIYINPNSSECTAAMISISLGIHPETCYVIFKHLCTSAISVLSTASPSFRWSHRSSRGRHIGPQKPASTHYLRYCFRYVLHKKRPTS